MSFNQLNNLGSFKKFLSENRSDVPGFSSAADAVVGAVHRMKGKSTEEKTYPECWKQVQKLIKSPKVGQANVRIIYGLLTNVLMKHLWDDATKNTRVPAEQFKHFIDSTPTEEPRNLLEESLRATAKQFGIVVHNVMHHDNADNLKDASNKSVKDFIDRSWAPVKEGVKATGARMGPKLAEFKDEHATYLQGTLFKINPATLTFNAPEAIDITNRKLGLTDAANKAKAIAYLSELMRHNAIYTWILLGELQEYRDSLGNTTPQSPPVTP